MPIVRSGYRSDDDRRELQRFYNSAAWKHARLFVLQRDGNVCRWCGEGPDDGRPLDVVHLSASTLHLLKTDPAAALDRDRLAAGHRRCHRRYSAGMVEDPPPAKPSDGSGPWGGAW